MFGWRIFRVVRRNGSYEIDRRFLFWWRKHPQEIIVGDHGETAPMVFETPIKAESYIYREYGRYKVEIIRAE